MISVLQRPIGHKLSDTVLQGMVIDAGGGITGIQTSFSHGLSDGQYVYVQSNVSRYNGFKYVRPASSTVFLIGDSENLPDIEFVHGSDATYQVSVLEHGVIAVQNPIVYELYSSIFPTNSEEESYTPAVVGSQSNANGYTKLNLSGNLGDATALEWIQVDGEKYQIIEKISDSIVIINLAYSASNTFSGPVTKYYNNYCINVEVYCGYSVGHPWYDFKPMELAGTLKFTPDSDGRVKFSISEIVRSYIITRNKLDLDTLPNNTDFSTNFYIRYFESYDGVSAGQIVTETGSITSDEGNLVGLAVNASMPFKGQAITHMSDHIYENTYLAKWLTLQDSVTWIVDKFMDLSFLNDRWEDLEVLINGELSQTLSDVGEGIIRVPLQFDTAGLYCVQMWKPAQAGQSASTEDLTSEIDLPPTNFFNTGTGTSWTIDSQPNVDMTTGSPLSSEVSKYLAYDYNFVPGNNYTLKVNLGVSYTGGNSNPRTCTLYILDSADNIQFSQTEVAPAPPIGGAFSIELTFTANASCTRFGIRGRSGGVIRTYAYNDHELTLNIPEIPASQAQQISEEFCITVVEECDDTIITGGDFRLLESGEGNFRLLE